MVKRTNYKPYQIREQFNAMQTNPMFHVQICIKNLKKNKKIN